jgi:acyl-CoA thioesterase FadM
VTTGLEIRYRLPTLLDTPSELRARILDAEADVMAVQATLRIDGKVRVQAESRWVRIDRK